LAPRLPSRRSRRDQLDKIFVWRFDDQKGTLTPCEPPAISLPPGDGPRHFAFHPGGRWLYSIQEEGSTTVLFDFDTATGRLTAGQTISTLPPGFAGSNFCSEILVSADGRFIYAGNRLHDSIAIFAVGANGTLTYVGEEWTRGDYPRSFFRLLPSHWCAAVATPQRKPFG